MCGASWSWIVRKSCICSPPAKYSAIWRVLPPAPGDPGLGAHPGVVAAERDRGEGDRRVAVADRLLVADLPGRLGELVDAEVADPGRRRRRAPGRPARRARLAVGGREALDDRDLAVVAGVDDERGKTAAAVAGDVVGDDDRLGDDGARPARGRRSALHERRVELGETSGAAPSMTSGRLVAGAGRRTSPSPPSIGGRRRRPGANRSRSSSSIAAVAPDLLGRRRERRLRPARRRRHARRSTNCGRRRARHRGRTRASDVEFYVSA